MKNIHKKSQMEIMGLLVIIILLSVGMLFTVNYIINKKPSTVEKKFAESQMASNILSAILKTSTPQNENDPLYCSKVDFTELLQDCAKFQTIMCNSGTSCQYANKNIADMLNKTLGKYNKAYRLRAWKVGDEKNPVMKIENLNCNENNIGSDKLYSRREPKLSPVPLNPGTLMVQFDICS
jgi:hypothetical protein